MKKILLVQLIALGMGVLQVRAQHNLEVLVKNIQNNKGILMVGLFNSEKTFTIKQVWKGEKPKPQTGTIRVVFENIPAGEYAISIIHDDNENGKLDSNFMGIPKEGFGFSNDAMGSFGPPSFEKAKFTLPVSQPLSVTLRYL